MKRYSHSISCYIRWLVLSIMASMLCACGNSNSAFNDWFEEKAYHVKQSVNYQSGQTGEEKQLATMYITDGSLTNQITPNAQPVSFYKINKGYALRSPIYSKDRLSSNLVMSKDKEYDWFGGMQIKWSF